MKNKILILAILLSTSPLLAQGFSDSIINEIERRVELKINPGIAIATLHPDGTVDYYNFGFTNLNGTHPVVEHSIFEIGSITKTFTALMLQEHSESINLNEPIVNHLPLIDNTKLGSVKVSDLLNHTSGLPRLSEQFSPSDWSNPFADYSAEKFRAELQHLAPDTTQAWSYSNLGYATLGSLIENATGKNSYRLFNDLFTKIGLSNTYIERSRVPEDKLAQPSYLGIPFSYWDFPAQSAYAGALKSSTAEIVKYLDYQKSHNPIFKAEKQITSPLAINNNAYGEKKLYYKDGWFLFKPDEETEILTHNGGTGGFSSFMAYNKANKTGVVVLSNSLSSNDDIGLKIIHPHFDLKHPGKGLAFVLAALVKEEKAGDLYTTYLSNKVSAENEVDIMQIYWLERYCFGQKKFEYSNELSDILVDLIPDDWEVYDLKGQNLEQLNQPGAALSNYEKAKELNPGSGILDEKIERLRSR